MKKAKGYGYIHVGSGVEKKPEVTLKRKKASMPTS